MHSGLSLHVLSGEETTVIRGLKRDINAHLVCRPEGKYISVFKQTLLSGANGPKHLLSMMGTNLPPSLQSQFLSEMKGKQSDCNPSKWTPPPAFHTSNTIDLHSQRLSLSLSLFQHGSSFLSLYEGLWKWNLST